ncbi:unnamed protein product [Arabis nemorensis]|uniref:Uncharacterized protein n=1 Tax=Arabis nemorensis TaxID=586526 RepID=A0A565CRL5_9BRAS|nr:unnamed protein product [Arabis nemorensis]
MGPRRAETDLWKATPSGERSRVIGVERPEVEEAVMHLLRSRRLLRRMPRLLLRRPMLELATQSSEDKDEVGGGDGGAASNDDLRIDIIDFFFSLNGARGNEESER